MVDLPRPEVKTMSTLAYTSLGEDNSWGPYTFKSEPSHRQLHVRWGKKITQLLAEEKIKVVCFLYTCGNAKVNTAYFKQPLRVQVLGGLKDVQQGLDLMRGNKHENKIVYNVSQ